LKSRLGLNPADRTTMNGCLFSLVETVSLRRSIAMAKKSSTREFKLKVVQAIESGIGPTHHVHGKSVYRGS
jgi:hypothetical protein